MEGGVLQQLLQLQQGGEGCVVAGRSSGLPGWWRFRHVGTFINMNTTAHVCLGHTGKHTNSNTATNH
jgi:hypothetical protein